MDRVVAAETPSGHIAGVADHGELRPAGRPPGVDEIGPAARGTRDGIRVAEQRAGAPGVEPVGAAAGRAGELEGVAEDHRGGAADIGEALDGGVAEEQPGAVAEHVLGDRGAGREQGRWRDDDGHGMGSAVRDLPAAHRRCGRRAPLSPATHDRAAGYGHTSMPPDRTAGTTSWGER